MTQLSDLRQWHHKWETQSDEDMDGVPGQGNALGHPCRFFGAGHSTSAPKGKKLDLFKAACLLINTDGREFQGCICYSVLSTWDCSGPRILQSFFSLGDSCIWLELACIWIKPPPWEVCHPNLLRTLLRTTLERSKSKGTCRGISLTYIYIYVYIYIYPSRVYNCMYIYI